MFKYFVWLLIIILLPVKIFSLSLDYEIMGHPLLFYLRGTEIYVKCQLMSEPSQEQSKVDIKILSGNYKGHEIESFISLSKVREIGFQFDKGDYALVKLNVNSATNEINNAYIVDYYRINRLPYLFILLIIVCFLFSGKRALLTLSGIGLKIFLIYFYLKIFINTAYPVLITFIFIFVTLIIIIFFNSENIRKKINSSITAIISMILIFLITYILLSFFKVNGFYDDYIQLIDYYLRNIQEYNISRLYINIIMATVTLSITGIIADISVSITSSLYEIYQSKPSLEVKELIKSGFKVGKDILSTEINTILLALYGANFGIFVISYYLREPTVNFLNSQLMAVIITNIFLGMLGIILTLIIGTFINGFLLIKKR